MIRITETFKDEKTVILRLDGKIVGTQVSDLEELCLHYRDERNKTIVLDFSGVSFINNEGVKMLERIKDNQMAIINCSLFIRSLLSHVISGDQIILIFLLLCPIFLQSDTIELISSHNL